MKKTNKNAGFTMAELIVALSVSIVAIAMVSVLIAGLFGAFSASTKTNQQTGELKLLKIDVSSFVQSAQSDNYTLYLTDEFSNSLVFKKSGEQNKTMTYDGTKLWANNQVVENFSQTSSVMFAYKNNLINCKITFLDNTQITFIV